MKGVRGERKGGVMLRSGEIDEKILFKGFCSGSENMIHEIQEGSETLHNVIESKCYASSTPPT